jgi:hypothetical protein
LIIAVVVTSADTHDRLGLVELLTQYFADGTKRLRKIWVDGAYPAQWLDEWVRGLKQTHKIDLEATTHQEGMGLNVFIIHIVKLAACGHRELLHPPVLLYGALLVPSMVGDTVPGKKLLERVSEALFIILIEVVMYERVCIV